MKGQLLIALFLAAVYQLTAALQWPSTSSTDIYAIRSQRDLTLNVSMDQLIYPAINLNTVLLEPLNYTYDVLASFTDLVSWGASRFFLDLYWNDKKSRWQVCPFIDGVQHEQERDRNGNHTVFELNHGGTEEAAIFYYNDSVYLCNLTLLFEEFLLDIVKEQWILTTDDNLNAKTVIVTLNLRNAIEPDYAPNAAVISESFQISSAIENSASMTSSAPLAYPSESFLKLSEKIEFVLDGYAYTPGLLAIDRQQSSTWNSTGMSSTGWPLLDNVLFRNFYRILFSFGEVEVSDEEYDIEGDKTTIFSSAEIPYTGERAVKYSSAFSSAQLQSSTSPVCSIRRDTYLVDITSTDNVVSPSFLLASDTSESRFSVDAVRQYIKCGFSPMLNATGKDEDDIIDYVTKNLAGSKWSWSDDQPADLLNISDVSSAPTRCARLAEKGWEVTNCYAKYRAACRISKGAYSFVLSRKEVTYYDSVSACSGSNEVFTVPRTALQNSVLQKLRQDTVGSEAIWIDVNSLAEPVRFEEYPHCAQ
ncbi:uncharacterized protein V2V93DRAFT_320068 [Kockiozyma suomiensis]|uniref:uncharacterized protein n=1 Tax=Kockiozyma suomiensis TaxID=1337062 RepID=UPI0033437F26